MTTASNVHAYTAEISADLAKALLASNEANRNLSASVVSNYARDMLSGSWVMNGSSITFSPTGKLLDGQHRLHAVIRATEQDPTFKGVEMLVVEGVDASSQVTIDSGRKRSVADLLKMRGVSNFATVAASTRLILAWEEGKRRDLAKLSATNTEIMNRYLETPTEIDLAVRRGNAVSGSLKGPDSYYSLAYWIVAQIDFEDAEGFFVHLASDAGHSEGDPVLALRRAISNIVEEARGARIGVASNPRLLPMILKAWNKYRAGEEVHRLTYRVGGAKPEPFPVAM